MKQLQQCAYKLAISLGIITSGIFLTNCVEKEEILGTKISVAQAGFEIESMNLSSKTPNLTEKPLTIHAKFNQEVTTIIDIISSSGARKKYQITGKEINQNWVGGHNDLQFFKTGDTCFIELSFYGIEEKIQDTLIIEKAFDFNIKDIVNISTNDFEEQGNWSKHDIATLTDKSVPSIQGHQYLKLEGTAESNSVYVGGIWLGSPNDNPMRLGSGDSISKQPDEVWFNIYAYGTEDETSEVFFTMFEKDYDAPISGTSEGLTDDGIQTRITFDHKGWKLFSFRYADIPFKTYNALTGNNKREPHRITLLDIALQSSVQGGSAKAIIDFPIITQGGPFDPSKY